VGNHNSETKKLVGKLELNRWRGSKILKGPKIISMARKDGFNKKKGIRGGWGGG